MPQTPLAGCPGSMYSQESKIDGSLGLAQVRLTVSLQAALRLGLEDVPALQAPGFVSLQSGTGLHAPQSAGQLLQLSPISHVPLGQETGSAQVSFFSSQLRVTEPKLQFHVLNLSSPAGLQTPLFSLLGLAHHSQEPKVCPHLISGSLQVLSSGAPEATSRQTVLGYS